MHQQGTVRKAIWVSTGDMIADSLTKVMNSEALRELFYKCQYKSQYASLCGNGVVDAYKGTAPSKKEKSEKGEPDGKNTI